MNEKQLKQFAIEFIDKMFVEAFRISKAQKELSSDTGLTEEELHIRNQSVKDGIVNFEKHFIKDAPKSIKDSLIAIDTFGYADRLAKILKDRDFDALERIFAEKPYTFPIRDAMYPHQILPPQESENQQ